MENRRYIIVSLFYEDQEDRVVILYVPKEADKDYILKNYIRKYFRGCVAFDIQEVK